MKKKYNNISRKLKCLLKYGFEHHLQNPEIRKKGQKRYTYNNLHFDSSYELALYIWLIDNNIDFEYQPNISFRYLDANSKLHLYCPDFRIEGFLYELKGQLFISKDGSWINPYNKNENHIYEAKHLCCIKNRIKIILSHECELYIDYIEKKYGKDFILQFRNSNNRLKQEKSKAELNQFFRNRKLDNLPELENNIYFKNNQKFYIKLKDLVEAFPKSYYRKLEAKGRKREIEAKINIKLPYKEIFEWILNSLPLLKDNFYKTSTKVTWILRGITEFPKCATCRKDDKFKKININPFKGYGKFCSLKCATKNTNTINKAILTKLKKLYV